MKEELLDHDGENLAVRAFLSLYRDNLTITIPRMTKHMDRYGYGWTNPEWVKTDDTPVTLTKLCAQNWLRHLFSLENRTMVDVARYQYLRDPDPTHRAQLNVRDGHMIIIDGFALDALIDAAILAERET